MPSKPKTQSPHEQNSLQFNSIHSIDSVATDLKSNQQYVSVITISFILDNILCLSTTPSLYLPYMATPIPLSCANCHMYFSHHGRVVIWLTKKCLYNHKCRSPGFNSPCCILFLTQKKSLSQSSHTFLVKF